MGLHHSGRGTVVLTCRRQKEVSCEDVESVAVSGNVLLALTGQVKLCSRTFISLALR